MGAKLTGLDKFQQTLKSKVSKEKQNIILEEVGMLMVERVVTRMTTNQTKPKTSSKTLDARRKNKNRKKDSKYPEGITLIDTGALVNSITYKVDKSKKKVQIGTNKEYARIHQFGGRAGRNKKTKIPARPYLYFTFVDKLKIQKIVKAVLSD